MRPPVTHYAPTLSEGTLRTGLLYCLLVTHCLDVRRSDRGLRNVEIKGAGTACVITCPACLTAIARGFNDRLYVHLFVTDPHDGRLVVHHGGADAAG